MCEANANTDSPSDEELDWLYRFFWNRGVITKVPRLINQPAEVASRPIAVEMSLRLAEQNFSHETIRRVAIAVIQVLNTLKDPTEWKRLEGLAIRWGTTPEEAQDLVQETLFDAIKDTTTYHILGDLPSMNAYAPANSEYSAINPVEIQLKQKPKKKNWLPYMLRQRVISASRRKKPLFSLNMLTEDGIELQELIPAKDTLGEALEASELAGRVSQFLLDAGKSPKDFGLQPHDVAVARLRFFDSLKEVDIAQRLGIAPATVSRSIHRIQERISKALEIPLKK